MIKNYLLEPGRIKWLHAFLLIAFVILAYLKIFNAGFMNWDDLDYVYNIRDMRSGLSLENLQNWFSKNYVGNYQPLPAFSYAIDHEIGGANPLIYHAQSILWHILAVILLYVFIANVQDNKWVAFFTALLFAIHPVQTESVSWIAARNKSMNAVFFFLAMYYYTNYIKTKRWLLLVPVVLSGILAYLCKATALSLPLALFSVDIWMKRPLNNYRVWAEKLPLIILGIPIALITLSAQKEVNFLQHHNGFNVSNLIFSGYALTQYVIHLVLPMKLSVLYPYPKQINGIHIFCLLLAVGIVLYGIKAFISKRHILAGGILFFLVNLLPVLQLVQFGETLMADRYLYIACVGVWFPLVYYVFNNWSGSLRVFAFVFCYTVSGIFCCITYQRNSIWLNEINFWQSVLDKFPESAVAQYSLGAAYMNSGDVAKASRYIKRAVLNEPSNYKAWCNKGALLLREGKDNEALEALNRSIQLFPYPKAYFTRAMLFHAAKKYDLAIADLNKVLQQQQQNGRAYCIKADCEEQLGKRKLALENYDRAIECDNKESLFLVRRGLLLAKSGNESKGLEDLNRAVELKPDNGEALYYRALILYNTGKNPCADLQLALKNGYERAREMLGKACK